MATHTSHTETRWRAHRAHRRPHVAWRYLIVELALTPILVVVHVPLIVHAVVALTAHGVAHATTRRSHRRRASPPVDGAD